MAICPARSADAQQTAVADAWPYWTRQPKLAAGWAAVLGQAFLCPARRRLRGSPYLVHSGAFLDDFLDKSERQWLADWKLERGLLRHVRLQLFGVELLFAADDRVQPDVVLVGREVDQASVVRVVRHPIAELFFSLWRRALDCPAKLAQHGLHRFGRRCYVGVNGLFAGCGHAFLSIIDLIEVRKG